MSADQLITSAELASHLQLPGLVIDEPRAALAIAAATATVQAAVAGQRLLAVTGDTVELDGHCGRWLTLPQRPVSHLTTVTLDAVAISDWTQRGPRLYRAAGWQSPTLCLPSVVVVVYDHGWPSGHQRLELARTYVFALAAMNYVNPTRAEAIGIDDYRESYGSSGSEQGLSRAQISLLRRAYTPMIGFL